MLKILKSKERGHVQFIWQGADCEWRTFTERD